MRDLSRRAVIGALTLAATTPAMAPRALLAADHTVSKRVALKGYDPVSYFTRGRPEKGMAEFAAAFDGATYWFSNAEHRARFVADPDRYAPQFSGFCAINISRGEKYEADPEAWVIADGRLYVFGAKEVVPMFQQHANGIVAQANQHWPGLR
jgi:YHS domain-containing protein